jgi:signal peptidase I
MLNVKLPVDPAWVTVIISGLPLLYLAVRKLIFNSGITKISSALLITAAMIAAIVIGDLFAAGEVAFIMAIGEILEDLTTDRAKRGLKKLISLAPSRGRRITDGQEEMISAEEIERGDIVVFNYPAGDVATTNPEVIDFHALCYHYGMSELADRMPADSMATAENMREYYAECYKTGLEYIKRNPQIFGEITHRPVDRRENYVKRCLGLPGNTLEIKDKIVYIDGKAIEQPTNVQFSYNVELTQTIPEWLRRELGISTEDLNMLYQTGQVPLTHESYEKLKNNKRLVKSISIVNNDYTQGIYPLNGNKGWTVDNYGPVWIPKRGESIKLDMDNITVYERPIVAYEGNTLDIKDGKIFINGVETDSYTFKMDYYWMMGDNRHNSADSRCWGFVPEDHIVGKALFVWLSLDKDRGWFDGKIRWNRLFRSVSSFD